MIPSQSTKDEQQLREFAEGSKMFTDKQCAEYTKIKLQEKTLGKIVFNIIGKDLILKSARGNCICFTQ